jgi:hypothetical protein
MMNFMIYFLLPTYILAVCNQVKELQQDVFFHDIAKLRVNCHFILHPYHLQIWQTTWYVRFWESLKQQPMRD